MHDLVECARDRGLFDGRDDGTNARPANPRPPLALALASEDALAAYHSAYTQGWQSGRDCREALLQSQDLRQQIERAFTPEIER